MPPAQGLCAAAQRQTRPAQNTCLPAQGRLSQENPAIFGQIASKWRAKGQQNVQEQTASLRSRTEDAAMRASGKSLRTEALRDRESEYPAAGPAQEPLYVTSAALELR